MENYLGRLLDNRYEILEVIGTGGMAVVYKALDHRLNRLVAVKILKDEFSRNQEFRRRFHAESQAVAMLSHPNIVSVYDVSRSGDVDYIVMELIEGITLKQYLEKKGCLNWRETLHFAMQIAKALEHAHSRGIVHRDIKPHNIMILKDGSIKVADFGIARIASAQSTLTREALGSVHYISPEQAKGAWVARPVTISIPSASSCMRCSRAARPMTARRPSPSPSSTSTAARRCPARSSPVSRAASSRSRCTPWPPMPTSAIPSRDGDAARYGGMPQESEPDVRVRARWSRRRCGRRRRPRSSPSSRSTAA